MKVLTIMLQLFGAFLLLLMYTLLYFLPLLIYTFISLINPELLSPVGLLIATSITVVYRIVLDNVLY